MQYESERIEYKSCLTDEIYKEVIAFANGEGGTVYIGINDRGEAVGIDDVDETYTRLTNGIRDAIAPDVTMFVRYRLREDSVIEIGIGEGSSKPYFLKAKGIKPTGVFVRQGSSSVSASFEQIRRMIKESDGDSFEENRSLEQELSFTAAERAFKLYGVEFAPEKFRALGLTHQKDATYTNLAWLLSDQCAHTTKLAVFSDDACTVFRDSREFRGSIFSQFENAVNYLALCNKTRSEIKGIIRTDKPDYPEEAIREALLNAIVHRDYGFSGSIIINVTDRKMEFISLGGLLPGLSPEDIRTGISQPRNRKLAEIFHRLRLIESYGTGIRRIYHLYEACPEQPQIELTANTFKIVLPNMNSPAREETAPPALGDGTATLSPQEKTVIDYLRRYGELNEEELQELLNIKKTRAYQLTRFMRESGLIEIVGRGAKKRYRLK